MLNSLSYKAYLFAAGLRRSPLYYWLTRRTRDLTFFTMMGLPFLTLGVIFRFAYADQIQIESDQLRHVELTCLARNIYFESRGESLAGQYAVAEVTLNRVVSKRFPDDVCAVVHEKRWDRLRKRDVGAFSWTEFDSLRKPHGVPWERATMVAVAAYDGKEATQVPGALFYHAARISPRWSRTKKLVAQIGHHRFYE